MISADAESGQTEQERQSRSGADLAQALAEKARMEAILWTATDGIITFDSGQRIVFFNPAAEKMFGIASADAMGEPVERFITGRILEPSANNESENLRDQAHKTIGCLGEITGCRMGGGKFPIEASLSHVASGSDQFSTVILRDITERAANDEVRALLAREVDHRAKNALALVQALVTLTRAPTHEAFVEAVEGRVAAIARAQTLLARNQWHGGDLEQIIRDEIAAYAEREQILCDGPKLILAPRAVQPVGLLIHELATNAVKYGALSVTGGQVSVRWSISISGMFELTWTESGGPLVQPPKNKGFGTTLISTVTAQQLSGSVSVNYDPAGIIAFASLPSDVLKQPVVTDPPPAPERGRVLVVEDEVLIAMQMAEVLADAGWHIIGPANSMKQALDLLRTEGRPDAALLDINLNGETAGNLAQTLKEAGVPVLICTGYETIQDERLSTCTLIRKPANVRQLIAGMEEVTKRAHKASV